MKEFSKNRTCPLCRKSDFHSFHTLHLGKHEIEYVICSTCGFIFQSHPLSPEELDEFYSSQYRQLDIINGVPTTRVLATEQVRSKFVGEFLKKNGFVNIKFALDIGSSTGSLLKVMQSKFDAKVIGVEPGEIYRKYAMKNKLEIYPSMEAMAKKNHTKFDLITMMHVLEHLDNPLEFLKDLRKEWLAAKGSLLIEVPNTYCHDSYEFPHVSAFTPHSFQEMLRLAGFQVLLFEKHGQPRSMVLPLYLRALARPIQESDLKRNVHPERLVALKRSFGMFRRRVVQKIIPALAWQSSKLMD
jgi:SAM-dependent methyltransferase